MKKTLVALVLSFILLFSASSAMAASKYAGNTPVQPVEMDQQVIFEDSIAVDEDGGRYQIGFVNVEFKKDFLDPTMLPAIFDVQVYAENGKVYIEFNPDTPNFFKKAHIRVDAYSGYIYDKALGKNIYVDIKNGQILAPHFSRYCVND